MKTAVSIPDDLFRQADALARRSGKSRSQVYREALAEYLRRRDTHVVTSELDALVDTLPPGPDPWVETAGRRALERSEW
jgi:metal-responsive CopG/Arc/MetJ family transcriptional regulator